jgi:hypothetical protein
MLRPSLPILLSAMFKNVRIWLLANMSRKLAHALVFILFLCKRSWFCRVSSVMESCFAIVWNKAAAPSDLISLLPRSRLIRDFYCLRYSHRSMTPLLPRLFIARFNSENC